MILMFAKHGELGASKRFASEHAVRKLFRSIGGNLDDIIEK